MTDLPSPAPDDQLAALEAEFPEQAPMLRQAMKDAPAVILRLQARVDELEGALAEGDKLLRFAVDRGLLSQHVDDLINDRDALKARVAELREYARRDSHDYELLRREHEQLREALGMARKEYGGKNIADLNEYGRLRLAVNGFQAMNGVLELQNKRQHARIKELKDRELQLQEQAGEMAEEIEELSSEVAELPEWHCPSCNAVTRARMADAAPGGSHPRVRELSMQVRIGELTTALTEIADKNDLDCTGGCAEYYGENRPPWCGACIARAALTINFGGDEKQG